MHYSDNPDHTRHDVTLIAGHAAGDLVDSARVQAEDLLATCRPCADLHRDLLAIALATHALPASTAPARDFRLAPEQAERLRRGSWLRAALRPFAASRSGTRPMAAAFTSLGIAGLLVATVLPALLGGSAGSTAPQRETVSGGAPAATSAAAAAPVASAGGPGAAVVATPPGGAYNVDNAASGAPAASNGTKAQGSPTGGPQAAVGGDAGIGSGGNPSTPERTVQESPPNLLLIGSIALLAVGLLLFGLLFAGRRLR
jgi:hypothetical protein